MIVKDNGKKEDSEPTSIEKGEAGEKVETPSTDESHILPPADYLKCIDCEVTFVSPGQASVRCL